jgi:hypothetical protein
VRKRCLLSGFSGYNVYPLHPLRRNFMASNNTSRENEAVPGLDLKPATPSTEDWAYLPYINNTLR